MLSGSLGSVTIVWVWEPRHVWTPGSCTGLARSEMSKIRTPRNRSALTGVSGEALGTAVDAAAGLLDRHEQQVAVHRDIALAARADERAVQHRVVRVRDVVDLEAVEAADDGTVTGEGEIGVDEPEVVGRRVERCNPRIVVEVLDPACRLGPREVAGRKPDPWILLGGTRDRHERQREECSRSYGEATRPATTDE